ncbi:hypothetical protein [Endothiovibrio diazotrophicus]
MKLDKVYDYAFFVSSSGHCPLDCHYCIVNPIVKHQPSLNYDDLAFLLGEIEGRSALFGFSGRGDFFAGYRKPERLLERLLDHDVGVVLDVNGMIIQELPELPAEKLAKIEYVNLTLHYTELLAKKALGAWEKNARLVIERMGAEDILMGFVLTPVERDRWEEALAFYEERIFRPTGRPLVMIRDVNSAFSEADEAQIARLAEQFGEMTARVHQEDFAKLFARHSHVLCPAGSEFFHIWNDGSVEGCPHVEERKACGNLKERRFEPCQPTYFPCATATYCECSAVAIAKKMRYPD